MSRNEVSWKAREEGCGIIRFEVNPPYEYE
jgi:hypothetical protein